MIETRTNSQPGINGGPVRRCGTIDGTAVIAYVCCIDVSAIDVTIAKVTANAGTIVLPKMAVPGVGWLAYAKDTEATSLV